MEIVSKARERALLVSVVMPGRTREDEEESLNELALLTEAAGNEAAGREVQHRRAPDPAYYVGEGKARELRDRVKADQINVVVFDGDLTPAQAKNLQELCQVAVMDRSWVILDIFARRARTQQAKLQVEIARLQYLLPHMTRQWTHLEQQDGGAGRRGGAGEQQIESDRRVARKRIADLTEELEKIRQRVGVESAQRNAAFRAALVGYTNSGKSTLFNRLAENAEVVERDQPFTTLDTTVRKMPSGKGRPVILSDTVGFIRKLPENLLDAFHTTLGEAIGADLLLHIIDAAAPDAAERIGVVNNVLESLGVAPERVIKVFNKIDALADRSRLEWIKRHYPNAFCISALEGQGLDELRDFINRTVEGGRREAVFMCDYRDIQHLTDVYRTSEVLERKDGARGVRIRIRTQPEYIEKFKKMGFKEIKARLKRSVS